MEDERVTRNHSVQPAPNNSTRPAPSSRSANGSLSLGGSPARSTSNSSSNTHHPHIGNHAEGSSHTPYNHHRTLRQSNTSSEETWMDFLRRTGSSSHGVHPPPRDTTSATEVTAASSRHRILPISNCERSSVPLRNTNTNTSYVRSDLMDRKRRMTTTPTMPTMSTPAGAETQSTRRNPTHRWSYTVGAEPRGVSHLERRPRRAHDYAYHQSPFLNPGTDQLNALGSGDIGIQDDVHTQRSAQGEVILPKWQPDGDVSACFVCETHFSFFFRKHHCRKCGRVVCANCSPHRITIPKQFIVQPLNPTLSDTVATTISSTLENMEEDDADLNSTVSGGEEVRVCNPCVPDPNLNPPLQRPQPSNSQLPNPHPSTYNFTPSPSMYGSQLPGYVPSRTYDYHRNNAIPPFPDMYSNWQNRYFNQIQHGSSISANELPRISRLQAPPNNTWLQDRSNPDSLPHFPLPDYGRPHPGTYRHTRGRRSEGRNPSYYSSGTEIYRLPPLNINAPLPPLPQLRSTSRLPMPPPPAVSARREVPEEDECPVCGNELPARSEDGSEAAREAHVQDCIGAHFAGPSSAPATTIQRVGMNTSGAGQPALSMNTLATNATATTHSAVANSHISEDSSQQEAQISGQGQGQHGNHAGSHPRRVTGTRMLTYRATEKDCASTEGASGVECVICFEEYEVGDEMARLECLCRFHKTCIRGWWDVKGYGSCPTHEIRD